MMLRSCPREREVKELVARGHWPQACAPELRAHVNQCRSCGDLTLVAEAFQQARAQAAGTATLVAPGVLWWRAQLRRRNQALERIGKPLLGAQVFALAFTLLLAAGFVVWQVRQGLGWLTWLGQFPPAAHAQSGRPLVLWALQLGLELGGAESPSSPRWRFSAAWSSTWLPKSNNRLPAGSTPGR